MPSDDKSSHGQVSLKQQTSFMKIFLQHCLCNNISKSYLPFWMQQVAADKTHEQKFVNQIEFYFSKAIGTSDSFYNQNHM